MNITEVLKELDWDSDLPAYDYTKYYWFIIYPYIVYASSGSDFEEKKYNLFTKLLLNDRTDGNKYTLVESVSTIYIFDNDKEFKDYRLIKELIK